MIKLSKAKKNNIMYLQDFDFELPEHLIAQKPLHNRSDSKLLYVSCANKSEFKDCKFQQILEFINPNDLLIFNDTKVILSRLYCKKLTGGKIEVFLERVINDRQAYVMLRASNPCKLGEKILLPEIGLIATVVTKNNGIYLIELCNNTRTILEIFLEYGQCPLPPYIKRKAEPSDIEKYQTVYAKKLGAVAAPTAGLHFSHEIMAEVAKKVEFDFITLHIGAGTFKPVQTENILQHKMHYENFYVSEKVIHKIQETKQRKGRVIAVGTTVTRCLESIAKYILAEQSPQEIKGNTNIFIYPGYKFQVVDGLLTNFHLPKSTLLMLVSAFSNLENIRKAYKHAIKNKYRFFSYGDAMLIL